MKLNLTQGFAIDVEAAAGDSPSRQISGMAVPYNVPATVSDGTSVMFTAGSLPVTGKAPKMFMYHDSTMPVGLVSARKETPQGMMFTASIVDTQAGTDALTMASAGVLDSVSVGVNVTDSYFNAEGVMVVTQATWLELSLVPIPAFADAKIESVYAARESVTIPQEAPDEPDTEPTEVEETEEMSEAIIEASGPESVVPTSPLFAEPKRKFAMPTPGEYMAAMHIGGESFRNVNEAYKAAARESQTALQAAAGDVATTDTPGLLPVPVLGPLVQNLNFIRPVVNALGARSMPSGGGNTFVRPTITTHTSAAAQSTQNTAVSATTMVIAANTVTKATIAGQVTLSVQDIDFTDPAALNLILNDLMGEYMLATEANASTALLAAATSSGVWDLSVADLMTSIYDAAYDISNTTNFFPTHMFVSPDTWAKLGQLVDSTNRPVFPAIGSSLGGYNTLGAGDATSWSGMNPLGLQLVVSNKLAAKTMIITKCGTGLGDAFEFYEQQRGLLSIEAPATLGRTFSYYGYVANFAAIPSMIRKITQA